MEDFDMDDDFEPQARSRSNTWPVRPKVHIEEVASADQPDDEESTSPIPEDSSAVGSKKGGSRKNAWGNFSYADLISKAIESSPEKRLTLAQIYDWLVQNVPYFKDKGDCNSSAGWKNSIRHNLSLHSRFIRVQNEGTGKSSWWMINPEAKGTKSSRRRTASMDPNGDLIKKRNKAKSRVEELRRASGLTPVLYRSESESHFPNGVGADQLIDPFAYGQQEFRMRSSSNASSYGRLSPLHPLLEPSASPVGWGSQQALAGDGCLAIGPTGNDNLADLWDTALTLSTTDVDVFGANSSEQLSMNLFGGGGTDAYLRPPPAYDEAGSPADIKPNMLQHSPHGGSHQSLNGAMMGGGPQLSPQRLNGGLQMGQPQPQSPFGVHLNPQPGRNVMLSQQDLEAQSLINELLADGIKNEAAMRYQYGTNSLGLPTSSGLQHQQQAQQQFMNFPDPNLGDFKPVVMNNNNAITSVGGDFYVQNTMNGGVKMAASPTLAQSTYPSLVSAPYGHQNMQRAQGPSVNSYGNHIQPSPQLQHHVASSPAMIGGMGAMKTENALLSLMQRQRQQHMSGGGLNMGVGSILPGDIDVSLQELRAGGLSCDMEQILLEGNLDLIVD